MPRFARVKRHIEQLLAEDPALAEEIRAMLPPAPPTLAAPKTPRKTAAKPAQPTPAQKLAAMGVAVTTPAADATTEPATA